MKEEIVVIFSLNGKKSEVVRCDTDNYKVNYFTGGILTHSVDSYNINEARRLAEGYVNSPGKPSFLTE